MALLARLGLIIPFVIAIAIIGVVVFFVVQFRSSPARAKEILLKVFTWIASIITGFFALASIYALLDGNMAVFELAFMFLILGVIFLVVVRICHYVFIKHHPHYKRKPMKAKTKRRWPWQTR